MIWSGDSTSSKTIGCEPKVASRSSTGKRSCVRNMDSVSHSVSKAAMPLYSMYVANPSFSHRSFHHSTVIRFPNHWFRKINWSMTIE